MPIDSSIYLQQQAPDFLGNIQKGLSMREMIDERKDKNDLKEKQKKISAAYQAGAVQNPDGTVTFDKNKTLSAMAGIAGAGKDAYEAQNQFQTQDNAQAKAKLERSLQEVGATAQLLNGVKDQATYESAYQKAASMGINVSQLPTSYDPGLVDNMKRRALTAHEEISNELQKSQLAVSEGQLGVSQGQLANQQLKTKQDYGIDQQKLSLEQQKIEIDKQKAAADSKNLPQNVYQAATFGKRIEDANAQMNALMKDGYDPTSKTQAGMNKITPEFMKGDNQKLMEQSQRNFVNALLRRESGSAISSTEFDSANKQYFPQVGDSGAVLAQKERNREVALAGLKSEGEKAWGKVEKNLPDSSNVKVIDGTTYRKVEGGWLPAQK